MSLNLEFQFDFGSPNAYLCHKLIPAIERRDGHQDPALLRALCRHSPCGAVGATARHGRRGADPASAGRGRARRARLLAHTASAHARGAFGSPTFFVGGQIYFGKDRLREVEEAIAAAAPQP